MYFELLFALSAPSTKNDLSEFSLKGNVKTFICKHYNVVDSFGKKVRQYSGMDKYEYSKMGYLSSYIIKSSDGDVRDRAVSSISPSGLKLSTEYYEAGKVVKVKRSFGYSGGLLTSIFEYGQDGSARAKYNFIYDNNVVTAVSIFEDGANTADTIKYRYDDSGRISGQYEDSPKKLGITHRYGYRSDTSYYEGIYPAQQVVRLFDDRGYTIKYAEYTMDGTGDTMKMDDNVKFFPLKNYEIQVKYDNRGNVSEKDYYTDKFGKKEVIAIDIIDIIYY